MGKKDTVKRAGFKQSSDTLKIRTKEVDSDGSPFISEIVYHRTDFADDILEYAPLKRGVYYTYDEEKNLKAQYLIRDYDTLHRITYENDRIVSSEGQYFLFHNEVIHGSHQLDISVVSVDIDSLSEYLTIYTFNEKKDVYECFIGPEEFDNNCWNSVLTFDTDTVDFMLRIAYVDTFGFGFGSVSEGVRVTFGETATITESPFQPDSQNP